MRNNFVRKFWGQTILDLGDRWRTNVNKLHITKGTAPQFSLNGYLLRQAIKENVPTVEVAFPERNYVISKSPEDWLKGRKVLKVYNQPNNPMDFYYHEVDAYFPREGKKKELYQNPDQLSFL